MGTPKKNAKATRKFEKKHLKGVLEKRKEVAKVKQRAQVKAKRQTKRSQDDEFFKGPNAAASRQPKSKKRPDATVSSMSVDDFFQGGFQILDGKDKKDKSKKASPLGKRKRNGAAKEAEAEADGSDSDASVAFDPVGSDSEDDDGDDGEGKRGAGMSQAAMDALAEKDPEFYQFLKENDPEALQFDEDVDLAEIDDLSEGEDEGESEEEDAKRPKKKQKKSKAKAEAVPLPDDNELTQETVAKWEKSLVEQHSLRAARQVVLAFRSAAHLNEEEGEEDGLQTTRRFAIKSPEVFHDILVVALKQIPAVLQHHVPVKESAAHRVYVATETKKFKTLSALVRSFSASVLHLLSTLSDDGTLQLTLSALTPLLPYLLSFRKLLKHLVKSVVGFWAQPASSQSTRITAFLVLRRLVVIGDKGVREAVLKATYQGLVQGCRATSANTLPGINLMKNSAAELWGLDPAIGYTTAFAAIRQLAIHLRNSIVHNQNNAFRVVYNWQYVHSLDFWSCVLAEHCNPLKAAEAETAAEAAGAGQLKLLVYPLVQVTLGAMRLIPTAAYFPLRFLLFRALLRVSRATGTYIPLAPMLLEVLSSAEMKRPATQKVSRSASTSGSDRPLDFAVAYKAPKSMLRTAAYQTAVAAQVAELLAEYLALWSTSIAFPELALPVVIMVKRWLKEVRKPAAAGGGHHKKKAHYNNKIVADFVLLVQRIEANAAFVEAKRARIDFAPRDRAQVDAFLKDFDWEKTPLGAFVVTQRKLLAAQQAALEARRKEDARLRLEARKPTVSGGGESDEESEESEEEEEGEEESEEDEEADEMEVDE